MIEEQFQDKIDIMDFEPDTVKLFLILLEDRQVDFDEKVHFRELNKMSIVFEVEWLEDKCYTWLSSRMNRDMVDEEKHFVFGECWYILRKWYWKHCDLMDVLIGEIAAGDNSSFILKYFQEFDNLERDQLELMLKLGYTNSKLFLQTVIDNMIGKNELEENIKHLLQKMNLPFCHEANNELYTTMLDAISKLPDISATDLKFIFVLTTETTRLTRSRNDRMLKNKGTRVILDTRKLTNLQDNCQTLKDVLDAVSNEQVSSMLVVVEILLWVFLHDPPNGDEMESSFISTLSDISSSRRIQKVPHQYLDMIISALKTSPLQQKEQLVQLLKKMKRNENLSTNIQTVLITNYKEKRVDNKRKHLFVFKNPQGCDRSDSECGFITTFRRKDKCWIGELSIDDKDYQDSGIHYHGFSSAPDICTYRLFDGIGPDIETPIPSISDWKWLQKWFPESDFKEKQKCLAIDISDYLIAKC